MIPYGSTGACAVVGSLPCRYYIGVYGYSASSFSVLAYLHNSQAPQLINGRPQNGVVNTSVSDWYTFAIPSGGDDVEIVLTARSGDPDLYVCMNGSIHATAANANYRSVSAFGNDVISIHATDAAYVANDCGNGCVISLSVVGFRESRCEAAPLMCTRSNEHVVRWLGQELVSHPAVTIADYRYRCCSRLCVCVRVCACGGGGVGAVADDYLCATASTR